MEIVSVKEFQTNWDELIERVENGEHIGVVNDNGQAAVIVPADDEIAKMYFKENLEAQ